MMGLRSYSRKVKGSGLKHKVSTLRRELVYAWQRAWKGYDESYWYGLDSTFVELYISLLTRLRKDMNSYPPEMTVEQWEQILDEMIKCLKEMRVLFTPNVSRDYDSIMESKERFFELFNRYFYQLWD